MCKFKVIFLTVISCFIFIIGADEKNIQHVSDSVNLKVENLDDGHYAILETSGLITVFNQKREIVSKIDSKASLFCVIGNTRLAAVTKEGVKIFKNITTKPELEKTITTEVEITAIANAYSDCIVFGSKYGTMHLLHINNSLIEDLPQPCKSEILDIGVKNLHTKTILVVLSLADNPVVLSLTSPRYMESSLLPKNKDDIFVTSTALSFFGNDVLIARGEELLQYSLDDDVINKVPKKTYSLSSTILSLFSDERCIVAGLLNGGLNIIDTEITDNKGKNIITARNFSAGSVTSVTVHPNIGIIVCAARSIFHDSTGNGKIIFKVTEIPKSGKYCNFYVQYEGKESKERREFYYSPWTLENSWIAPEGKVTVSTDDPNIEIEASDVIIDGRNPVYVSFKIKVEPKTQPIMVTSPALELLPPILIDYFSGFIVSGHGNLLLMSERNKCSVIQLPGIPHLLKAGAKSVLIAIENKLYDCHYNSKKLNEIFTANEKITNVTYVGDMAAIIIGNEVKILCNGKTITTIMQEYNITAIDITKDEKYLLVSTGSMTRMFEIQNAEEIPLHTTPSKETITQAAFSDSASQFPSARYFATYDKPTLRLFDAVTGQQLNIAGKKELQIGSIDFLRFNGNDQIIYRDTAENTIRCISITSGNGLYSVKMEGKAETSPFAVIKKQTVAYVSEETIILKNKDELGRISITKTGQWFFTIRDTKVPILFQAHESIINMFTEEDGRTLTADELLIYKTAELPL